MKTLLPVVEGEVLLFIAFPSMYVFLAKLHTMLKTVGK
jgi:hypothetical protein